MFCYCVACLQVPKGKIETKQAGYAVGPCLLLFFIFVVVGSSIFEILRVSSRLYLYFANTGTSANGCCHACPGGKPTQERHMPPIVASASQPAVTLYPRCGLDHSMVGVLKSQNVNLAFRVRLICAYRNWLNKAEDVRPDRMQRLGRAHLLVRSHTSCQDGSAFWYSWRGGDDCQGFAHLRQCH